MGDSIRREWICSLRLRLPWFRDLHTSCGSYLSLAAVPSWAVPLRSRCSSQVSLSHLWLTLDTESQSISALLWHLLGHHHFSHPWLQYSTHLLLDISQLQDFLMKMRQEVRIYHLSQKHWYSRDQGHLESRVSLHRCRKLHRMIYSRQHSVFEMHRHLIGLNSHLVEDHWSPNDSWRIHI